MNVDGDGEDMEEEMEAVEPQANGDFRPRSQVDAGTGRAGA